MKKNRQQRRARLSAMLAMVPPTPAQAQFQSGDHAKIDKHYPRLAGEQLGSSGAHTPAPLDQAIEAIAASVIPSAGHGTTMAVAPWPELQTTEVSPPVVLSKQVIRDVFLANGFKIPEGQIDLREYVYAAAQALLAHAGAVVPPAPSTGPLPYAKSDDHFLDYYDKSLADLPLSVFDNDQLGNAAFLHYDDHTLLTKLIDYTRDPERNTRPPFTPIGLMTAVKERLRWLDRRLRRTTWERDQALAELAALKAK